MQEPSSLTTQHMRYMQVGILIALCVLAFIIIIVAIPKRIMWDYQVNLHLPAQLVVQGLSAYDNSITGYPPPVWFPQIIGQFFWLGWLSLEASSLIWLALTTSSFVLGIYLILPRYQPSSLVILLVLTLNIFPPMGIHYNLGQISLYTMLLLVLTIIALEKKNIVMVGILLALAGGKPQLIVLPVIGIALVLWKEYGWRGLLTTGLAGIITTLILLIPLFIADTNWIEAYLQTVGNLPFWGRPSIYHILLRDFNAQIAIFIFIPIALALLVLNVFIWIRLPIREAMIWSMSLNLIAIPLLWTWDYTLLFPLYAYYLLTLKTYRARIILVTTFIALIFGFVYIHFTFSQEFIDDWWMPIIMVIGTFIAVQLDTLFTKSA